MSWLQTLRGQRQAPAQNAYGTPYADPARAPYGGSENEQYRDALNRDRTGAPGLDQRADASRQGYLDLIGGGQAAAEKSAQGLFQSVLPSFTQGLHGLSESQVARGVTGGATEAQATGSYVSDFSRNLANALAGQATSVYGQQLGAMGGLYGSDQQHADDTQNRYLDLLTGKMDRDQGIKNSKRQAKAGMVGGLIGGVTTLGGGYLAGRGN